MAENAENAELDFNVWVLTSLVRDSELICNSLVSAEIKCRCLISIAHEARNLLDGADVLVVLEEALDEYSIRCLANALRQQPPWSDLPVIVLTGGGAVSQTSERLAKMRAPLGNVTLMERPVRPITLLSSVRAAIRARQKQYEIRDYLEKLKKADYSLRRSHELLERKVAERTATLRQLSSTLMRSQDEERRRIARELHDSLGQYLAALGMDLNQLAATGNPRFLSSARKTLDICVNETRTLSHLLHPPLLDEIGLASAIQWYVEGFVARSGLKIDLKMTETPAPRFSNNIETTIFRVLQEALTNIHRHSNSKTAEVSLEYRPSEIVLKVADHGTGMPKAHLERFQNSGTAGGVGLAGMRERVMELGGTLRIKSSSEGTNVKVSVPIT